MGIAKTNAVRLLDRLGIFYELREYEVDPDDLAAETVARKVGLPPEQVFKTLVARGDKHGICLAVVPGHCELDLKALARATGNKKIDTVPLREVEPLTGYISRWSNSRWPARRHTLVYPGRDGPAVQPDLDLVRSERSANPDCPRRLSPVD